MKLLLEAWLEAHIASHDKPPRGRGLSRGNPRQYEHAPSTKRKGQRSPHKPKDELQKKLDEERRAEKRRLSKLPILTDVVKPR